jgi:outer membrane protein TolC
MKQYVRRQPVMVARLIASLLAFAPAFEALCAAPALTLDEAQQLALREDPMLASRDASAVALQEAAVADAQLPDPKFKFSLFNYPTDTFSRTREPITQLRFGVNQAFPRGDTLALRSRRTRERAEKERARLDDDRLFILKATRTRWLEAYYWMRAEDIVLQNLSLFGQLVDITESQYAAGKQKQQDVLRAELELGLLQDRLTGILTRQESARAQLGKWIGNDAYRPFASAFPELPQVPALAQMEAALVRHPKLSMEHSNIRIQRIGVDLAREAYKPAWSVGVDYGIRGGENADGSERADFVAATVVLDVPLFTGKRQDRRLAAAQQQANAALLTRDDRLRDLRSQLHKAHAEWRRLGQRLHLYETTLLKQAGENTEASLNAYQSDATDFATLMRARITELNAQLQALRIRVDRAKSQAELLYFAGDSL